MITKAIPGRYFAIYYTGMTHIETGDWAVVSDEAEDEVARVGLADIFQVANEVGFKGIIWFSLDASYIGQWVLEIS